MERFALSRMKEWKENENRKPLIIRGARQVGNMDHEDIWSTVF